MSRMLTQVLPIEVRELEPREMPDGSKKRRFSFVGATENGVRTPWGPEHLRMDGARLDRYRANPVVLDAHNRSSSTSVIGRAEVKREGRTLVFDGVEFAGTAKAREVEGLVADGFVRACSIGFVPDIKAIREIAEGATYGEGESLVRGPATVIPEWELIELSMVPIGADQDALRREFYEEAKAAMDPKATPNPAETTQPAQPVPAPAPAPNPTTPATRAEIEAIVPRGFEAVGERCLLEGLTLATARAVMLAEHAKRHAPVGTPEAPQAGFRAPGVGSSQTPQVAGKPLTNVEFAREFRRSLVG